MILEFGILEFRKETSATPEVTSDSHKAWWNAMVSLPLFLCGRAKLGHGLLSGQYAKPPMKSELIEQVMKEEHRVLNWVCPASNLGL